MKKKTNKFTALIVTAACMVTCMLAPACTAYGAGAEEDVRNTGSDKIASQIADQFADPSNDPFDYTQKSAKRKAVRAAKDLPETFDLRNVDGKSYVTSVKNQ